MLCEIQFQNCYHFSTKPCTELFLSVNGSKFQISRQKAYKTVLCTEMKKTIIESCHPSMFTSDIFLV